MKVFYLGAAWLSLILGIIGIFIPLLPTTPFLILSIFIFSKYSPQAHQKLMQFKFISSAVEDWQRHRVIGLKPKIIVLLSLSVSSYFIITSNAINMIKAIAILSLVCVLVYIFKQKTYRSYEK